MPLPAPFAVAIDDLDLEPWPLDAAQVVEGTPEVSGLVLHRSDDGRVERGVWRHTPGVSRDVEADELFVVLRGRATVAIADGPTLELRPGHVGVLGAGDRTVWTVQETLVKAYQVTS